jgi:predicted MFS family arabinose efflux permease
MNNDFGPFLLFTGLAPMMFSSVIDILGIPIGTLAEGIIMVSIYLIGGIVTWWYWQRPRASIGWLLFALAMLVLLFTDMKNNPPVIIAFFGSLIAGFGFIITESLHEVENRSTS